MEELIKQQTNTYQTMKKSFDNYKKDGKERKNTPSYFEFRITQFNGYWNEFKLRHDRLLLFDEKDTAENTYFKNDVFSKFEEVFITCLCKIQDHNNARFQVPQSEPKKSDLTQNNFSAPREELQLPRISLPKFSGDYSSWTSFHDLFKSLIHDNHRIPSVQKLHYLKTSVTGQAEHLLKHHVVSEQNYEPAWNLLVQRYENKRMLVNSQLKNLLNQPNLTVETADGMKRILDTTFESLQALQNFGINIKDWDAIIIYIIVQKFPIETHKHWEEKLGGSTELPKLEEFKEFLETRFRVLEAISNKAKNFSRESRNTSLTEKGSNRSMQSFHSDTVLYCFLCSEPHHIRNCPKFVALDYQSKMNKVKTHGLCINCLGRGHMVSNCPSKMNCFHCKKRHHSLLHVMQQPTNNGNGHTPRVTANTNKNRPSTSTTNQQLDAQAKPFNMNSLSSQIFRNKQVLLPTALVKVVTENGNQLILRALIDQGSQASFVSEAITQKLRLKRQMIRANVTGVGGCNAGSIKGCVNLNLHTRDGKNHNINVKAYILKNLTNWLPNQTVTLKECQHLQELNLADPSYNIPGKIDIILGAEVYSKIISSGLRKGCEGEPIAQETVFGWIISGEVPDDSSNFSRGIITHHASLEIEKQLKRFWEIEEVITTIPKKPEDEICENNFERNHIRMDDGRYQVNLPFIHEPSKRGLGKSRDIAIGRLIQMEKRFDKEPEFFMEYSKCISEYMQLGHMIEAKNSEDDNLMDRNGSSYITCSYLPHHAVRKESSSSTKFRVVFDASRKTTSGMSLNDSLHTGPTIQDDLSSILLRWRRHKYAFTSDIEKMYRQIRIQPSDQEYQRIVWRNSKSNIIKDYNLTTVTFGVTCAPYLAIRTLQQLAKDEITRYPEAANTVLRDFYVDDLLSGSDSIEGAMKLQKDLIQLLESGGLKLRKWSANDDKLLKAVPKEFRNVESSHVLENQCIKALGIHWYPNLDYFSYKVNIDKSSPDYSKRKVLGDIARLYDPLGWLAPIIISAKIFLQTLWLEGLDWDDRLPSHLKTFWEQFSKNLNLVEKTNLPRWVHTNSQTKSCLHGFSDASTKAYAAVLYLVTTDEEGITYSQLLTAKTKVAPIKTISLPRLELCGAALLAKLIKQSQQSLQIDINETIVWTDSEIVISWLRGHPSKWKTFVANRVTQIHEILGNTRWRHVPSKHNPADCASRGLTPAEIIKCDIWWNGPTWLKEPREKWPSQKEITEVDIETKKISVNHALNEADIYDVIDKFSSMTRLIRVIAYCRRFIYICRSRRSIRGNLTSVELEEAHNSIIAIVQRKEFTNEENCLRNKKPIDNRSRLINLHPILDDNGLLRVGGRLQNSILSYDEIHPIILPDKNHFVTLIIRDAHKRSLHGGTQLVISVIRQKFWLINARNAIRFELHRCTTCYRFKTQTMKQLFGNLPTPRVSITHPFTHTGVDYCGPFQIRVSKGRGTRSYKGYVAVFVCLAVKAIHLEVVSDLSTESYIAAFRRFTSRRGLCTDIYSDCGTNFVGANNALSKDLQIALKQITEEVATKLTEQRVNWHFIPPSSPHFGGLWEAGVKSVKYHLCRTLKTTTLTFEEFYTVLTQIEACLNSRPLTEISSDPNDLNGLTPAHFLIGRDLLTVPGPSIINEKINCLTRWKYQQQLAENFWQRWSHEYLTRLQQRPKWLSQQSNIKVGQLILVKDERLPPLYWKLGRIVETHPGKDDLVRVATIRTEHNIIKRPIVKLCLLPIIDNELCTSNKVNEST